MQDISASGCLICNGRAADNAVCSSPASFDPIASHTDPSRLGGGSAAVVIAALRFQQFGQHVL
jgi:hypothetical protein